MYHRPDNHDNCERPSLESGGIDSAGSITTVKSPSSTKSNPGVRIGSMVGMVAALALAGVATGCGGPEATGEAQAPVSMPVKNLASHGNREKQAAFLNQIRSADPNARTIDRALINGQNELGLILDRTVELENIPALMSLMLTKMAAQFPGEDLTVLAYTPSDPPRKVGTARLNARTRDMSYTRE